MSINTREAANHPQAQAESVTPRDTGNRSLAGDPAASGSVLFFDGVCGLCNRFVDFTLSHDARGTIRLAPLQGETAARLLSADDAKSLATVVLLEGGRTFRRSSAVVRVLQHFSFGWRVAGALLWLIPRPLRDLGYAVVAKNRYRLFGKKESCRMPTPAERARFLP